MRQFRVTRVTGIIPCFPKTCPTVDRTPLCAGVVGLAIGRILALSGQTVLVVEQAKAIGTETSSRNSEVIHSGEDYCPGAFLVLSCKS